MLVEHHIEPPLMMITLNRPEKLNALNTEVLEQFDGLLTQAQNNPDVRGLLLCGKGKAFCAGADIQRLAECDALSGYQFANQGQHVFRRLETLGKPSLAAIQGYAFGGGCELAMAATFRIADTAAQFGQPEIKLGVMPGYGGTQRLARLVGKGRALDLCLTGRFIDANTALHWGLIHEIAPTEALLTQAKTYLNRVVAMAPQAIASILEAIDRGYDLTLDDALHLEALQFAKVCSTADKTEGVSAFLEKRAARFKGQ